MFVSLFTAYTNEKLIINKVKLKSLKNDPLGKSGIKFINIKNLLNKEIMVGRVGYAPTTPAMSMQYSTIELTALN